MATTESGAEVQVAPAERLIPVRRREDALGASREAQRLGQLFGLGKKRAAELAIVVSELGSNIAKYGVQGEIGLSFDTDGLGTVRVVARDVGPPFQNLEIALTDGCNDRGPIDPADILGRRGLGTGLGAVLRLADQFECRQDAGGKEITVHLRREPATGRRRT
ncbi:MAG TPA: ATP-binding protein [Thermoanaerobaculia bacterium]|nr:ATP-binding protein [Thermoanaerobaculia bacterium]